jgi:hypothetical protein
VLTSVFIIDIKGRRLRVFQIRVLRRIFEPKMEEIIVE